MSQSESLTRPIIGIEDRTAQEVFDIMCDRIAAWNRRPSTADRGGEVEVRALEWREPDADDIQDCDDCLWMATGMGGRYAISTRQLVSIQSPDKMGYLLWDADDAFSFTEHLTIEAAKAAAQADFTARIRSALVTTAGDGWQTMESAPKDGSRLWLVNPQMESPVIGQWGDYRTSTGKVVKTWIVTHDPHERFQPLRYGTLITPSRWQLLPAALVTDKG